MRTLLTAVPSTEQICSLPCGCGHLRMTCRMQLSSAKMPPPFLVAHALIHSNFAQFFPRYPSHEYRHRRMRLIRMLAIRDNLWHWKARGPSDHGRCYFFESRAVRPFQYQTKWKLCDLIVEWDAAPTAVIDREGTKVIVEEAQSSTNA